MAAHLAAEQVAAEVKDRPATGALDALGRPWPRNVPGV